MTPWRTGIAATIAVAVVAIVALLVSASRSVTARTFALGVQNAGQVAVLHPGDRTCEGPVSGAESTNAVGIWGGGLGGPATITITAQVPGTGRTLASGTLHALAVENRWTTRLKPMIAAHRSVRICLRESTGSFTLSGAGAVRPSVVMSGAPGHEFALVLLSQSQRSLLSWLPTAFARASLWRPSWTGAWTFWVLAAAVLATFGLAVRAVVTAAADDDGGAQAPDPDPDPQEPTPDAPAPDEPSEAEYRSEAGQDGPQAVH